MRKNNGRKTKTKGRRVLLNLSHDLGVNIASIAIIPQMHERLEEINRQMQSFVEYVRQSLERNQSNCVLLNFVQGCRSLMVALT